MNRSLFLTLFILGNASALVSLNAQSPDVDVPSLDLNQTEIPNIVLSGPSFRNGSEPLLTLKGVQQPSSLQSGHGALISAGENELRVEVGSNGVWGAAIARRAVLPDLTNRASVTVTEISDGARWFIRLYGDMGPQKNRTNIAVFQLLESTGTFSIPIDPRRMDISDHPAVQIQLGLEGGPGDYVVFQSLEFHEPESRPPSVAIEGQINIDCVEMMPNMSQPYEMRDWRATAQEYDAFVFDLNAQGEYLPLAWIDDSRVNIDRPTFGLASYVGDGRYGSSSQEGITAIGAVLGATLAGIDKSKQEHNYVDMCEAFYNRENGRNIILNRMRSGTGGSFWYEIWPNILYAALADCYPDQEGMDAVVRVAAERWFDAYQAMGGREASVDFNHTAFNFDAMEPRDNGRWREPDAAAGVAWVQYAAWKRSQDPRFLEAAEGCIRFLDQRDANPYYEVLLPWGALIAARLNAEEGHDYNVKKMVDWRFGVSDCRGGWGVMATRWGEYDCHGLVGSIDNRAGYAFAMNTFAQAGALVPLVRYDSRFARAMGKWMLNTSNAARLFYPGELPPGHESSEFWMGDPEGVIAYEGLRAFENGRSPIATGDPLAMNWGPKTDLGLYGSSYVGFFGGIISKTNDRGILQLDCLATDFYRDPAYPTFLYYNPHPEPKQVTVDLGDGSFDLYDAVSHEFVARGVTGSCDVRIPADRAVLLTLCPSGSELELIDGKRLIDGVVIDYNP